MSGAERIRGRAVRILLRYFRDGVHANCKWDDRSGERRKQAERQSSMRTERRAPWVERSRFQEARRQAVEIDSGREEQHCQQSGTDTAMA